MERTGGSIELLISVALPTGGDGTLSKREDLRLAVRSDHTVRDLSDQLTRQFGFDRSVGLAVQAEGQVRVLESDTMIRNAGLVSGDFVVAGPQVQITQGPRLSAGTYLQVSTGDDVGAVLRIGPDRWWSVGRGPDNDLVLSDPQVSRNDLAVHLASDGVSVVVDPGEGRRNELRVGGSAVSGQTVVNPGSVVLIGATALTVYRGEAAERRPTDAFGAIAHHRTPYLYQPVEKRNFPPLGRIPSKPKPRRFQMIATVAPLFTGATMAVVMDSTRFLLFAAMSPVVAIATHFDHRWSGGNDYKKSLVELDERLEKRAGEVREALQAEREARHHNAPDVASLIQQAKSHDKGVWARGRSARDFLELRVGLGEVKPDVDILPERQGDDELKDKVAAEFQGADRLADVPVGLDLAALGTVALLGDPSQSFLVATSQLLQAACLHSPEDVVIASVAPKESGLNEVLKWLPHVRSRNSPLAGAHLADDHDAADLLVNEIGQVAEARAMSRDKQLDLRWPWILLAIDQRLEPDPALVARLLDLGATAGVSVLWLTSDERRVPRQAQAVLELKAPLTGLLSTITFVDPDRKPQQLEPDRLPLAPAEEAARALAPLRDASAVKSAASVPSLVTLFQALGRDQVTPQWIAQQWSTDRGYSLPAPVGLADTGPVELDLVKHGPHGLIGGTSGAGKSELVQSLIANLVALNSPERVNILFVDYKGGALSGLFKNIPHAVGAVTNLDALLSLRALTSLKAELDRRMRLFEAYGVKDLKEMLEAHPSAAPPSLVIVVDEFASLVRELPEFVDGIVSIAERGRSLGIHLLLSTQRPSGSINENIQQNTNLRVSLRMLDGSESINVIGTADAATIPSHMKGRAYARLGPGELIAFQSSWSGAPANSAGHKPVIGVSAFRPSDIPQVSSDDIGGLSAGGSGTQLDVLLAAVTEAAAKLNLSRGRPPWMDTLKPLIPLGTLLADPRSLANDEVGAKVTVGMVDDPDRQDQYPLTIDLADGGGLVIYGNGGSGKTTALTTVAVSAAVRDHQAGGGNLSIFGLDFASRQLGVLADLPQCEVVANGDDLEAVTRVLDRLERVFNRRQQAIADAIAAREPVPQFGTVLLVIDGYENLAEVFGAGSGGALQPWSDLLSRLANQGRQVRLFSVVASGSFSGAAARLMNTMGNRIALRQTDDNVYRFFGVPANAAQGLTLKPGQGLTNTANMMQIGALCSTDAEGREFFDPSALTSLGARLAGHVADGCRTEPLPASVSDGPKAMPGSFAVPLGLVDLSLDVASVDLDVESFLVVGPRRSGRSTALATVAQQLCWAGQQVWSVGRRGSPLAEIGDVEKGVFGSIGDVLAVMEELAVAAESSPDLDRVLVFDDMDKFEDIGLPKLLKRIVDNQVRLVGSTTKMASLNAQNPMQKALRSAGSLLILRGEDDAAIASSIGRYRVRPGLEMPPGRGILVTDGRAAVTQVFTLRYAS